MTIPCAALWTLSQGKCASTDTGSPRQRSSRTSVGARHLVVALGLGLLCSCRLPERPRAQPSYEPRQEIDTAQRELSEDLEATILEHYRVDGAGFSGALGWSTTAQIVWIGVRPGDAWVGRPPERDTTALFAQSSSTTLSKNLTIQLSESGAVAWVYDEVSLRVLIGTRIASIPMRRSQVFVRELDRWLLAAEHTSYPQEPSEIVRRAQSGSSVDMTPLPAIPDRSPHEELFRGLLEQLHRSDGSGRDLLWNHSSTLVVFPDPELELRGPSVRTAPQLATLFGSQMRTVVDQLRVFVGSEGSVAWVVADLSVSPSESTRGVSIPMRGSYVLRKEQASWRFALVHVSVPIAEDELSRSAFGFVL